MTTPERPVEKTYTLLKRLPDIRPANFRADWLAARQDDPTSLSRDTIVLNEIASTSPRGDPFPYDAIGQFRQVPAGATDPDGLTGEPCERLLESRAADSVSKHASILFSAWENIVLPAKAPCKLIIFSRKSPSLSSEEYSRYWRTTHAEVFKSQPDIARYLRGYVQNHIIPTSMRRLNGAPVLPKDRFDGCVEMWFDSEADARSAFSSTAYLTTVRADEHNFIAVGQSISAFVTESPIHSS